MTFDEAVQLKRDLEQYVPDWRVVKIEFQRSRDEWYTIVMDTSLDAGPSEERACWMWQPDDYELDGYTVAQWKQRAEAHNAQI